nr:disintegrin and metalloproteinase domain-containing protein 18-like isoform X3 [Peromyscus maniculatus bairdii]
MPLLFTLVELAMLLARLDSEGIYLHITVPVKTEPPKGAVSEGKVTYVITIDGKPHSLHLRNYSFLSQDFLVHTYNETGFLYSDSSHLMTHCHYRGYVDEFPNSTVTLNICSGLRGFLQLENISYGIEPLESSAKFEHIVYQLKNDTPVLAENYSRIWQMDQLNKGHPDAQDKNHSQLFPQSLKLHIIVGKSLYDYMGSDTLGVTQKIFQIIGLVNTMFTQLDLAVVLASLELWSDKDQISTDGDANDILQRFLDWKRDYLTLQSHEITHLLIYREHPKYIGAVSPGDICNKSYAAGVAMECLFKECCHYETCRLKASAKCGSGACCTSSCELSAAGTPCRKAVDPECDFTEYCSGSSNQCVPDTFALNGHLCRLGSAYCYNGRCQALNDQCVNLFGKGSQGASYACFEKVNSPREKLENCGFKNSYPLPCGQKDVLCGKLTCFRPHKNYKSTAQSVIYSYVHDSVCLSIPPGLSMRSDGRDYAYVADGTVCGPQMYCVNRTCKEVTLTRIDCNATKKCKGNGICNNFGNCQCFPDYRPPDCNLQIGSPGGSIDDGNIIRADLYLGTKHFSKHQDSWLILSFLIFLPFIITFIIGIMKRNERKIMPQI